MQCWVHFHFYLSLLYTDIAHYLLTIDYAWWLLDIDFCKKIKKEEREFPRVTGRSPLLVTEVEWEDEEPPETRDLLWMPWNDMSPNERTWTFLPLNEASLKRCVPWMMSLLDDDVYRPCYHSSYSLILGFSRVPHPQHRSSLLSKKFGWDIMGSPGANQGCTTLSWLSFPQPALPT
jgi:hypothetical protein